jgi:type I site-specific restriction endonuclease
MSTEAETRKKLIDTKLSVAGWDVNDCAQVIATIQ